MSCKSALYAINTTVGTAIPDGAIYSPNRVVRRFGPAIRLDDNGIILDSAGYYKVSAIATVTATAVGNITATLYKDGIAVPGATTTVTATAIGDEISLPISALVRVLCNCQLSTLTVVISGQATTSFNLAVDVEKE